MRQFLVILAAILVAYFFLHVLRSFNVAGEARGIVAGIAGYMTSEFVARGFSPRRRKR